MATTLWHVTSNEAATAITAHGFRDGQFHEAPDLLGVYLADSPTWDGGPWNGPETTRAIAVVFDDSSILDEYEVIESSECVRSWREWFVPAAVVNKQRMYLVSEFEPGK